MTNNSFNKLKEFRIQIDAIDRQVISLLKQRMNIIKQVAEYKKTENEVFYIKSSREADMLKKLIADNNSNFSTSSIVAIWRKIITNANMQEQPIKLVVHNPNNNPEIEYILRDYYNNEIEIHNFDSITNIIAELQKDSTKIGIFSLPNPNSHNDNQDWWINLANNQDKLTVFASLPFLKLHNNNGNFTTNHQLVAVAKKQPEQSSQDITLLVCEINKDCSLSKIQKLFEKNQLHINILKINQSQYFGGVQLILLQLQGFFLDDDAILQNIKNDNLKPYIKIIGHYPTIIEI
jgi:chorismate mutase